MELYNNIVSFSTPHTVDGRVSGGPLWGIGSANMRERWGKVNGGERKTQDWIFAVRLSCLLVLRDQPIPAKAGGSGLSQCTHPAAGEHTVSSCGMQSERDKL